MEGTNSRQAIELGGTLREAMGEYPYKLCKEQYKAVKLETNEFIRRPLQHVLPENFYKIRYIGILSMANAQTKKAQCTALINAKTYMPMLEGPNTVDVVEPIVMPGVLLCPKCKKGGMVYKIRGDS